MNTSCSFPTCSIRLSSTRKAHRLTSSTLPFWRADKGPSTASGRAANRSRSPEPLRTTYNAEPQSTQSDPSKGQWRLSRPVRVQVVCEHHVIVRTWVASRRSVEPHRRLIVAIGENPRLAAPEERRMLQEGFDNGLANPTTMMAGSDGDLVDEHLCRLVRMHVVHT